MNNIECQNCGAQFNKKILKCTFCKSNMNYDNDIVSTSTLDETSKKKFIQNKWNASIELQTENHSGSGFIISDKGYVLTNSHVVSKKCKVIKGYLGRKKTELELELITDFGSKNDIDLSLLKIKDFKKYIFTTFDFENEINIGVGDTVYTIGNGGSYGLALVKGTISRIEKGNHIQLNMVVNPGNSGGVVFNEKGNVVGIIEYVIKDYDGMVFGIKTSIIKELIKDVSE